MPVTGGTAKRLTEPFLEPARPDWSPKGDLIAFQSFKGGTLIWLISPMAVESANSPTDTETIANPAFRRTENK